MSKKLILAAVVVLCLGIVAQAAWVTGVTATTNSTFDANGNGPQQLVDEGHMVGLETWATYYSTGMWLSEQCYEWNQVYDPAYKQPYLDFAFGAAVELDEMYIWNGAQILAPGRALKYVDITYSTDNGATYSPLFTNIMLTEVPGLAGLADWTLVGPTDVLALNGLVATNVRINTKPYADGGLYEVDPDPSNVWTPSLFYGLTQVHFTEVPEPASMLLLSLGSLAFLRKKN